MRSYLRAVCFAFLIVVLPGISWTFVTHHPPRYHKGGPGTFYYITEPWVPVEFRPAIDEAAQSWNFAGSMWTFYPGFPTESRYDVEDGVSVVDFAVPVDSNAPGESVLVFRPSDPADILEADTALNSDLPFATSNEPGAYDVQSVALHEFGHWLELLDSSSPGDAMYSRIERGEFKRFLSTEDVSGIRFLYPLSGAPPGGGGGGNEICYKSSRCGTLCYQQPVVEFANGLYKPMLESVGQENELLLFEGPGRRALLFAILNHLPELQHIGLSYESEMNAAWEPITREWLPGLRWLAGDDVKGEDMELTPQRAQALLSALDVIQRHASRSLRRDVVEVKRYVRTHTGVKLGALKSDLFLDYRRQRPRQ